MELSPSSWIYVCCLQEMEYDFPAAVQLFGRDDTENTWKIKVADRKSLLNLH